MTLTVLTAHHLIGGDVVFLTEAGWSPVIDRARCAEGPGELSVLQAVAREAVSREIIVDPRLVEVRREGGRLVPLADEERH
jgi:Protein of unknown function (DUF2849)